MLSSLSSDVREGLSKKEVETRLAAYPKRKQLRRKDGFFKQTLRQFESPIALILLCAVLITFFLKDFTDSVVIALALLINVVIGVIQEGRASHAFEALKKHDAKYAFVIREGVLSKIEANLLVPGDIISLSSGNAIPADARLIEAKDLTVNEAALSGEWLPVEKNTNPCGEEAPLSERLCMVYAGTLAVSGTALAVVTATNERTEIGAIGKVLHEKESVVTPLTKDMRRLAWLILYVVLGVCVIVFFLGVIRTLPYGDILAIVIALAVASVPEGLPAAVTVVLALGMERILKAGGLVRNLLAAETLGTTTIVLTDKTGTLTEGKMILSGFVSAHETFKEREHLLARRMLHAGVLASGAHIEITQDEKGEESIVAHGRPVEQALLLAGLEAGISKTELLKETELIDILSFESSRRFSSALLAEGKTHARAYIMGAPELLLSEATHTLGEDGKEIKITPHIRAHFESELLASAKEGKRMIAVGEKVTRPDVFKSAEGTSLLSESTLLGFFIFSDAVRVGVNEAIQTIQDAGARVIMLTGDNPQTALAIATQTGIAKKHDKVFIGSDLDLLTDNELLTTVSEHHVFARVAPAHKLRIANILVTAGESIAMTGDGVNDAPALKAATIGIAIGSGTEVAKEASDIVILKNGFSVITHAIAEGRRLRDNFKKIFTYMLSTSFSAVSLIIFSLLMALPLPILPTQILWANLVQGALLNFAFAFEPLHASLMRRNPRDTDVRDILSSKIKNLILLVGSITSLSLILMFVLLLSSNLPLEEIQTYMYLSVCINAIFLAFSMKSFGTPLWRIDFFSNPFLLIALLVSSILLVIVFLFPWLQALLSVVTPSLNYLPLLLAFGISNVFIIELAKWMFFIHPEMRKEKVA